MHDFKLMILFMFFAMLSGCATINYSEVGFDPQRSYRIVSLISAKSLSVVGAQAAELSKINQFRFKDMPTQRWNIEEVAPATYKILAEDSTLAISVEGRHSSGSGYGLILLPYRGVRGQHWHIEHVANGRYIIYSAENNAGFDVRGGATADGVEVMLWPQHGSTNQKWLIKEYDPSN